MSDLRQETVGPSEVWPSYSLGETSEKIQDGTHFSPQSTSGPYRYITSKNIRFGRMDIRDCDWISEEDHCSIFARCDVRFGDILLTKDGANTGNATLNTLTEPFSLLSSVALIRSDQHKAHSPFVLQYLLSSFGQQRIKDLMEGNAITRLTLEKIRAFRIPLPPLSQQCKIAQILTTLDNVIEKTETLIAKYQAIKQGIMNDLFTRGIDSSGSLRPTQLQAPDLYKQSELGWIPKEWEEKRLGEKLEEVNGWLQTGPFGSQLHSYEYVSEGVPVIMPQEINNGSIQTETIARITPQKARQMRRHWVDVNDIVFSRRGDLCRCAAIGERESGWICGTGCFLLRVPSKAIDANWLSYLYRQPAIQRQVEANAVGSTMPSLNNAVMGRLRFVFPPVSEQREIARRIASTDTSIKSEEARKSKVLLSKSGLMQDLLTGKVRVKCDESEGVASNA